MTERDSNLGDIEARIGVSFADLRTMAAEAYGATYNPMLLHAEQLVRGIGSLGVDGTLEQTDIDAIVLYHTHEQTQLKGLVDLPFSECEHKISRSIFDTLAPLKHPDQYATYDSLLAEFSNKTEKALVPTILGRLGTRGALEVGIRYARKKRGNFPYAKWPSSDQRREYVRRPDPVLGALKVPYTIAEL